MLTAISMSGSTINAEKEKKIRRNAVLQEEGRNGRFPSNLGARFGPKVDQNSPKWEKSEKNSDQIQFWLDEPKCTESELKKNPRFGPFGSI